MFRDRDNFNDELFLTKELAEKNKQAQKVIDFPNNLDATESTAQRKYHGFIYCFLFLFLFYVLGV